ncbi:hypothetical protein KQ306_00840 [Synechococcus sp. CS-1324]|nr:hypothetical protein [Synechococcus sp. CS-1324]
MADQSNTEMSPDVESSQDPQPSADTQPSQDSQPSQGRERSRQGGREAGGFRIRLSDNEQRAAQLVQESFQLRSTVAALGFSIRTVAQLLEQGKLDELVVLQRSQAGARPEQPGREPVPVRRLERGERRGEARPEGRGEARTESRGDSRGERRVSRPDPFARPSRPQPAPEPQPIDDTPLVEVAPLIDPALLEEPGEAVEAILPVTIEPEAEPQP